MPSRRKAALALAATLLITLPALSQKHPEIKPYDLPQPATESLDYSMYARIREEGLRHSHVMEFAGALSDDIGPRLTGSPNMAKANAWTRDTLAAIGLSNAHLEDWGEFGMGWQQINTWARMVSPDPEPLWLQAAPWSPATKGPVSGEIVYIDPATADAAKLKGTLAGKIILLGAIRPTPDITEPLFHRYTDAELKEMEVRPTRRRRPRSRPPRPNSGAAPGRTRPPAGTAQRPPQGHLRGKPSRHHHPNP